MSNSLAAAEAEARTLQAEIDQLSETHVAKKAEVNELRSSIGKGGIEPGSPEFDELDAAYLEADNVNGAIAAKQNELNGALVEQVVQMRSALGTTKAARMTWGARYTASNEYVQKVASLAGRSFSKQDELPRFEVATAAETATFLASTDGSAMIPTDERLTPIDLPSRRIRILDMIQTTSTTSDAVQVVRESLSDDQAAAIAHASAGGVGVAVTGVATPLSEYRTTLETRTVRRIGHHTIVPRSMLADAPRLQSRIDNRLARGIRLETERLVLSGDGTGENFSGIITEAAQDQAHSNAADSLTDSVHKAMTLVRIAFEEDITGLVMHPTDYQDYVLSRDGNGSYENGVTPFTNTPNSAWGYPVAVTTLIPAGTVLAGDFSEAILYVRQGIEVMSGYINAQMIEDTVTLNAEYRAAFGVDRTQAFCTVTRGA